MLVAWRVASNKNKNRALWPWKLQNEIWSSSSIFLLPSLVGSRYEDQCKGASCNFWCQVSLDQQPQQTHKALCPELFRFLRDPENIPGGLCDFSYSGKPREGITHITAFFLFCQLSLFFLWQSYGFLSSELYSVCPEISWASSFWPY